MNRGLPTVYYCASELCLSPNYFGDLIKKETGQTAIDYIHKHVIDATKELLADPSKTITEVSYQIGFQHPQHMSRLFKKETGMTPAQYRSQLFAYCRIMFSFSISRCRNGRKYYSTSLEE